LWWCRRGFLCLARVRGVQAACGETFAETHRAVAAKAFCRILEPINGTRFVRAHSSFEGWAHVENWQIGHQKLQLLVEYFKGYSPNGQFYTHKIETIGLGAHLRF
jgi:hypothetical protein